MNETKSTHGRVGDPLPSPSFMPSGSPPADTPGFSRGPSDGPVAVTEGGEGTWRRPTVATNLDVLAGERVHDGSAETGERGADAGIAAHGAWDHAARLARTCALSPYRRMAVECLCLRPGDTAIDIGCSSAVELERLQRAVGTQGQVLVVESEQSALDRVGRWISHRQWTNVHPVRADLGEYKFPAEVAGILCAGTVARVRDVDAFTRKAAAALRTGGRLVLLDSSLMWPRLPPASDESHGACARRGHPCPPDLYLWRIVSRHLSPALFLQRLFGAVFMVAGESR